MPLGPRETRRRIGDDLPASSGKIAWYESDGRPPPTFTERVISTAADMAGSGFATDVDGDGETDVLSASFIDNKIAWYENSIPRAGSRSGSPMKRSLFQVAADPLGGANLGGSLFFSRRSRISVERQR